MSRLSHGYIEVRKGDGQALFEASVPMGSTWEQTLTRHYNRRLREKGDRLRSIGTRQHFPGGGTYHVQMGYPLGTQSFTLDDLIVVWVSPEARES